ncbi:MAG TPA: hypothetical protein VMH80_24400 [Bryobacteraceae bacterium]|nr:hypothetical protein [Bryobacteraceae bacterium]
MDRILPSIRDQPRFPPEIAGLRLQVAEEGNAFCMSGDVGLPEPAKFVEKCDRIRTGIEQIPVRANHDFESRLPRVVSAIYSCRGIMIRLRFRLGQKSGERSSHFLLAGTLCVGVFGAKDGAQHIASLQAAIDKRSADCQAPGSGKIECLFRFVCNGGQVRKTRGCARTFDGMNRAKYAMNEVAVLGLRLEGQERCVKFG